MYIITIRGPSHEPWGINVQSESELLSLTLCYLSLRDKQTDRQTHRHTDMVKGKVLPYSLPSVGYGADPGVQAVSPQVT